MAPRMRKSSSLYYKKNRGRKRDPKNMSQLIPKTNLLTVGYEPGSIDASTSNEEQVNENTISGNTGTTNDSALIDNNYGTVRTASRRRKTSILYYKKTEDVKEKQRM